MAGGYAPVIQKNTSIHYPCFVSFSSVGKEMHQESLASSCFQHLGLKMQGILT